MDERPAKRALSLRTVVAAYAALAGAVLVVGLLLFWSFLTAYEASRPRTAVDGYMETLSAQHILDMGWEDLLSQVDGRLQDAETCKALLLAELEGELTYARKTANSTEDTQFYALKLGDRVIGSLAMERTGKPAWGFTPWRVTGEAFDLSALLGEPVRVAVPEGYTVYADGRPLSGEFVAEETTYDELAELDDSYDLPRMFRYEAGPILGEITVSVTDPAGKAAPEIDTGALLDNCTDGEKTLVEDTVRAFLKAYVDYTTRNISDLDEGLAALKKLMIPDGRLAQRMERGQHGLSGSVPADQTGSITDLEIHLISRLGEGLYFCDLTFTVDASYRDTLAVTHANLVFRQTGEGLLAETMISLRV